MEKIKLRLNWFGHSGKIFNGPWFIIEFMGLRYGDAVNSVTAEYLLSGICCEHSVSILGQKKFVDEYGDEIVTVTSTKDERTISKSLRELWECQ
ncbi:MAG: hypothetical protein J7L15_08380 [Clostridiales bacterium]|nr:hypothetical protein [Clostridiales bacterium]